MIASSTALMQACKRGAPLAGIVSLTECSAEVPCTSIRVAVHKLSVNKCMRCSQLYSMRSVDMVAGSATLVQGMRAFILWTGTRSVIEVFSRGPGRTTCVSCVEVLCKVVLSLACMSCSCRLITARSVTLARASTRMRRLFRQQQAMRVALQSYALITPARGIPGFPIELCCFYHPSTWPFVRFRVFFVLLLVRWPFS